MGVSESKSFTQQPKLLGFHRAKQEVDFSTLSVCVDRVNISGLGRTYDDYVQRAAKGLFTAKNFQDMILECNNAWMNLNELGIFKDLRIQLDVSKGKNASPNGYEITFVGNELTRLVGTVGTEVGQNEGSMTIELTTPNILGRGERIGLHASYSNSKTTDVTLKLSKPFFHTVLGDYKPEISLGISRHTMFVPISSYKSETIGAMGEFRFLFPLTSQITHALQYEVSFREVFTLGKKSPFFVYQQCGPRMASLVRHIASFDKRDSLILPTRGMHLKCTTEFSGFGGNVSYVMSNIHAEMSVPLFAGISVQLVSRLGIIKNIDKNHPEPPISSLFTLGGPLTLRGFKLGGVGPHSEGYAMGMNSYWATGLHFWAPLPFYSYLGRLGNNFKTHFFYNFGNCNSFTDTNFRSAAGFGIAIRLGERARVECNYCYPIDKDKDDRSQPGFQFGIGYEFL